MTRLEEEGRGEKSQERVVRRNNTRNMKRELRELKRTEKDGKRKEEAGKNMGGGSIPGR